MDLRPRAQPAYHRVSRMGSGRFPPMKMIFEESEDYPVFYLRHPTVMQPSRESYGRDLVEIPDELVVRYEAANTEWQAVQKELKKYDPYGGSDD